MRDKIKLFLLIDNGGASMYPGGMVLGACGYLAANVVNEFLGSATTDDEEPQ